MKHLKRNIATADCSDFATASRHSYAQRRPNRQHRVAEKGELNQ